MLILFNKINVRHSCVLTMSCGIMAYSSFILLSCFFISSMAQNPALSFPEDFLFGVATSSYQTEGSWNVDGKGLSMWDQMLHTKPNMSADESNGDIACDSYRLYKRDIEMLKELEVKTYRFSISWPRILPSGRPDYVNPIGIAHYNELIDELLANDIIPFVTMYHWDLPENLNKQGGWLNESIIDWFGDYAKVLYKHFGDRVKYWLTINEPFIHCTYGYGKGLHAPGIKSPGTGFYDCGRHILLANARAYHIYNEEFRASQNGLVGPVLVSNWPEPATDSQDDADAAASYKAFMLEQYADPIFSERGNYPQLVIDRVAAASAEEGYNSSRLKPLTAEEINYIKGSSDFFAVNTYTTDIVYRNKSLEGMFEIPSMDYDAYYAANESPFVPLNGGHELREYAPGFYKLLTHIKNRYNNPPIYIMENGFASRKMGLEDDDRVAYIRNYLTALLAAVADGANVKGYTVWTIIDDFEWASGYTVKMGLYEVNFTDPSRTRIPRKSALVYKDIIRNKYINYNYNPDIYDNTNNSNVLRPFVVFLTSFLFFYL